jgi:hypothetical protein
MANPPQLDLALQEIEAVIQRDGTNVDAFIYKGDILEQMGRLNEAEAVFQATLPFTIGSDSLRIQQSLAGVRRMRAARETSPTLVPSTSTSGPPAMVQSPPAPVTANPMSPPATTSLPTRPGPVPVLTPSPSITTPRPSTIPSPSKYQVPVLLASHHANSALGNSHHISSTRSSPSSIFFADTDYIVCSSWNFNGRYALPLQ